MSERLRNLISARELRPGQGLPPERRLAVEFSVSRSVVRGAIQQLTKEGVILAKPNCRPVVSAPIGSRSTRKQICIWLWPNTADFAAASILKGIQEAELGENVRLTIASAPGGDWNSIYHAERNFLNSVADDPDNAGLIVWYLGRHRNLDALERLRRAKVPIVFIDRLPPDGVSGDFVGSNNESAAQLGVQHLLSLGHRRIGLITNMDGVSSVKERERGFERALRNAGIPPTPELIQRDSVDEKVGVENALDNFLRLPKPPTAIFCINDHLALQLHDVLITRNIKVPEQISLMGFDGLLRWVPGGGYLSTLNQDFYRMGQLAASLVIERMTNDRPEAYKHLLLDAPLADHGSTARPYTSAPSEENHT